MPLDENLRIYATDRQWELLEAAEKHGSERAAAKALGTNRKRFYDAKNAVITKAAKHGYSPAHDMTKEVPQGFRVKGVSTLYDADGEPKAQWVKSEADREKQEEAFRLIADELASDLPRAEPQKPPEHTDADLMAGIPIGDHHFGMMSWHEETGQDYSLSIGERVLTGASNYLIDRSPSCGRAVIAVLGDYFHYDNMVTRTPTSGHDLDSDTRYEKMVRVGVRVVRRVIEKALEKHGEVLVEIIVGNHDPSTSAFFRVCLANIYENEPRVTVNDSPSQYHYFDFGKCLVGLYHGHRAKLDKLPMIMATDRPELWGQTKYRYWWTGHIHHDTVKDFTGCRVESFRVLPPQDAHATNEGYRSLQDMKCIILHREYGEVARHTVNPEMF